MHVPALLVGQLATDMGGSGLGLGTQMVEHILATAAVLNYVWTQQGEPKVCAYFAICPTEVVRKDDGVPGSMAGGYSRIPGYLIAGEAQSFYEHYHFVPVRSRERRLVMKVSTAAKALGERWHNA